MEGVADEGGPAAAGGGTAPLALSIRPIEQASVHRICSGQVILSLAIAVKELIENGIDAGATSLDVRLREHGAESLEVADNGRGVDPSNYQALTLKYHTSKLAQFSDLEGVSTFGFRGEALSSLCALSDMTITTRTKEQEVGVELVYDRNGKITSQSPHAREVGTTVTVRNLFCSLPVRHREFKRNIKKEFGRCVHLLQAYCLIATDVTLNCTNTTAKGSRTNVLRTRASSSLRANLVSLFGAKQMKTLMEFKLDAKGEAYGKLDEAPEITGYVSSPEHGNGRSNNDRQFFSVNRRPCDVPKIAKAINEVYHQYNRHQNPVVVLDISVPRQTVDVNVTPDKRSVMLHTEDELIDLIKESLVTIFEPTKGTYNVAAAPLSFHRSQSGKGGLAVAQPKRKATARAIISDFRNTEATPLSPRKRRRVGMQQPTLPFQPAADPDPDPDPDGAEAAEGEEGLSSTPTSSSSTSSGAGWPCRPRCDCSTSSWPGRKVRRHPRSAGALKAGAGEATGEEGEMAMPRQRRPVGPRGWYCTALGCVKFQVNLGNKSAQELHYKAKHRFRKPPGYVALALEDDEDDAAGALSDGDDDLVLLCDPLQGTQDGDDALMEGEGVAGSRGGEEAEPRVRTDSQPPTQEASQPMKLLEPLEFDFSFDMVDAADDGDESKAGEAEGAGKGRGFRARISRESNAAAEAELQREITKADFARMQILGQFNLGFIITRIGTDLFIIDQHATDEKYNYERLQRETVIQNQKLIYPKRLELTAVHEDILRDNVEVFQKNGFDFVFDEEAPPMRRVKLTAIPYSKGTEFGIADIEELIFLLAEKPGVMCRPSRVSAMFASRSCRSSIMIGTALNRTQMRRLVNHMGEIEQPWNCPHGRPTMRHVFDLAAWEHAS